MVIKLTCLSVWCLSKQSRIFFHHHAQGPQQGLLPNQVQRCPSMQTKWANQPNSIILLGGPLQVFGRYRSSFGVENHVWAWCKFYLALLHLGRNQGQFKLPCHQNLLVEQSQSILCLGDLFFEIMDLLKTMMKTFANQPWIYFCWHFTLSTYIQVLNLQSVFCSIWRGLKDIYLTFIVLNKLDNLVLVIKSQMESDWT